MNKCPVFSLFLCLTAAPLASAATLPAGFQITNQAQVTLQTPQGAANSLSNVVSVRVAPVCAVSVTPNGSAAAPAYTVALLPGESSGGAFAYQVRNVGNDSFTFALQGQQAGGSADPALTLRADSNGNNALDERDPLINSVTLAPGVSARVWLVAQSGPGDRGRAELNLIASCADGSSDADNVSVLTVAPPPVLEVSKAFGGEVIRPGESTSVTVTLRNTGESGSREVLLTDLLADQMARGLTYLPGSARTSSGALEYRGGEQWTATEPASVEGVRVRLETLAPGGEVRLTFQVRAEASAENQDFVNVAEVASGVAGGAQASDTLRVQYRPAVAIGPLGQPEAQDADRQTRPFALSTQETCFDHTVRNTGDVQDAFQVSAGVPQGVAVTLRDLGGAALTQPLTLAAGASLPVRVCYLPGGALAGQPLNAVVTVRGERGSQDTTRDEIGRIETRLPGLLKTVSKDGDPQWQPGDRVSSGDSLIYRLQVTNPYAAPLTGVQVRDPLPAHLDVLGVSGGGTVSGELDARVVSWALGTLAPGETRSLSVTVKVSERAKDDEEVRNVFEMVGTDFPQPLASNPVSVYIWNAAPLITKVASAPEVTLGDVVTYTLTLKNTSPNAALTRVIVTDTPSGALAYVPGTSRLDGQPLPDPALQGGTLRWELDRIAAGGQRQLQYGMRVLPGASGELANTVVMEGQGASGKATAVASNRARANIKVQLLNFAPLSDIVGTVYLDRDGDGAFDAANDQPVSGARVILAGGRLSLTDERGRYHFGNVPLGIHALRLDPGSVPYRSAAGSPATRTVQVQGLTSVHFALQPNVGRLGRRQSWTFGPLTVGKTVTPLTDGEVAVELRLSTPRPLHVTLSDPLPTGARLSAGQPEFGGRLAEGDTTLKYRYRPAGSALPLTQPNVTWKE